MSLFYEDDFISLYLGKMEENVQWLDADVLITDPPYGMSYQSNFAKGGPSEPIIGDRTTELRDLALRMWGPEKAALVFGTWRANRPAATRQLIIWHKGDTPGMGDLTLPFGPSHEEIYALGGRGGIGWTGKRRSSVIRVRNQEGVGFKDHDHPTPKPVLLMQELVSKTTGVIADPFAGSGATLVAAKMQKRRAIGVELDATYCKTIVQRLERIDR